MLNLLEKLCNLNGTSGNETAVRSFIINEIKDYCDYNIDALGNILFEKKGKARAKCRVMLDAHMDEVGVIITGVTRGGFLKFHTVGGVEPETLLGTRIVFGDGHIGVVGSKPIHLSSGDESKKPPKESELYIDIGASSQKSAESLVPLGAYGVSEGDFTDAGDYILSKALDDRVGCATLISLIKSDAPYDFCGSFSVMEEIGCIGAGTASFTLMPDIALILEGTTASDLFGVAPEKTVCKLGKGVAVSFMDGGTVYDRSLYNVAINSGILCQPKSAVTGGNDSATVHKSRGGVRTLALSVPCRYIHSPSSVCAKTDIFSIKELTEYMLSKTANGEV